MSDLDGFTVSEGYSPSLQKHFGSNESDDFGFDPPTQNSTYPNAEQMYSPIDQIDPLNLNLWSGRDNLVKDNLVTQLAKSQRLSAPSDQDVQSVESDRALETFKNRSFGAVARFGQITPPRSDSATSEDYNKAASQSPRTSAASDRRKRAGKMSTKEEVTKTDTTTTPSTSTTRKRKNSRKVSSPEDEQDDKRKQSLEKNRLAAAKCRINKKEKTEQLQRDSHDKAVHNAFLKEQVMRMKEEAQQINALLLAHASCDGCKSPNEIQKHLNALGNEFFNQHMSSLSYGDYPSISMSEAQQAGQQQNYFDSANHNPSFLNPPLPEFDPAAEFEVHTPMQTD